MKRLLSILLVVAFVIYATVPCLAGEWYPVLIHTHTPLSDGGKIAAALAGIIRTSLSKLRPDGRCAWVDTEHFDALRDYASYAKTITDTSVPGHFIAMAGLELGSKWHPEPSTVADANMLAIGELPNDFYRLANFYDKNPDCGGNPLVEKFDCQQKLIDEVLALGMLPVAAHPTQLAIGGSILRKDNRFDKNHCRGILAVEQLNVLGPGQDDECVNWYLRLVQLGLAVFVTAGSDYHGTTASAIPDAVLDPLSRVTWVYADDFSQSSILRAISEGKTCATGGSTGFSDFYRDGGQIPALDPIGVDSPTITAQFWLTGRDISIIVYRNGAEITRQRFGGSLTERGVYGLGTEDGEPGWTDRDVAVGTTNRYVVRVVATTKLGEQTMAITSPITLRQRADGQTTSFFDAISSNDIAYISSWLSTDPELANARDPRNSDLPVHANHPLALSFACAYSSSETVKALLDHGAEPDCRLTAGEPGPLMEVAYNGDCEKAQLLLSHGANINVRTDGNTPLIWAIDCDHQELARLLIESGADVNLPGDRKVRPLKRARQHNMDEIEKLLLEKGARE
ncbi:MAG: ankyrin repeat domain-containing protein [Candidatus Berkelbacteria bacterium]